MASMCKAYGEEDQYEHSIPLLYGSDLECPNGLPEGCCSFLVS